MKTFESYIFKNLSVTGIFIAFTLAAVIFLTQSLKFLELVIESGASGSTFWTLTLLALPRFFEIILPLALLIGTLFVYNRMTGDSQLVVARSFGFSPLTIARPAIIMALIVTTVLWSITMWIAPQTLSIMQSKRAEIKAQFSRLLFKEGIFNQAGEGLTVYARQRGEDGALYGLLIHDGRDKQKNPSTIIAKSGQISADTEGVRVLVFDGQRHEYDPEKKILNRLNFQRYMIDIPDNTPAIARWKQPDERSIAELLNPNLKNIRDRESAREFTVELHRRIISPLLALTMTMIACMTMLVGPVDRRGQFKRITLAVSIAIITQSLYIAAYNMAAENNLGLIIMYVLILAPSIIGGFILSGFGDQWRRNWLYNRSNTKVGHKV